MPLSKISGKPYIFCGNVVQWTHNQENKSFDVPLGLQFPDTARFIQFTDVEIVGMPAKMFGPYILLLHDCVVSGTLNDQHGPNVFFSGLEWSHEHRPIVQLDQTIGHWLRPLKFTIQLLDARDEVTVQLIN